MLAWSLIMMLQEGSVQELRAEGIDLLGGRLSARFPEGATLEARRRGIMAAPESAERESRVVWTSGEKKLVVMTYELFETTDADFEKQARGVVAGWGDRTHEVKPYALKDGTLRACSVTPAKLDLSREAVLVLGLYVARADGTVQYLAFYVNPAFGKEEASCAALARRIAETVTSGKRSLNTAAGKRVLHEPGEQRIVVDMPAGFALTSQRGPDFTVASLTKLCPMGSPGVSLNAYFGRHPGYQHAQRDDKPDVKEEDGTLLGAKVRWHVWSAKEETSERHVAEAIVAVPGTDGLKLHAFAVAGDAESLKALRTSMQGLRNETFKK